MKELWHTHASRSSNQDEERLTPFTILVAEDDSNDSMLLERAFQKVDRRVSIQVVDDGEQVMAYLERRPPFKDAGAHPPPILLLLDLKMPRLDGFGVLEWLLWRPELRPRFVVVFTASEYAEDIRRARVLGADSYLVKPQDPADLIRIVRGISQYWIESVEDKALGGLEPGGTTLRDIEVPSSPHFSALP